MDRPRFSLRTWFAARVLIVVAYLLVFVFLGGNARLIGVLVVSVVSLATLRWPPRSDHTAR